MVSEFYVKLQEAGSGGEHSLYSTHIASENAIIPLFVITAVSAEDNVLTVCYLPPDPDEDAAQLSLSFTECEREAVGCFVSEVRADIIRRELQLDRARKKAEVEAGEMPQYDRATPKCRYYDRASGELVGDELLDCYGEYRGKDKCYLGDYKGGKMHGNGRLCLTVADDPILAAPDGSEVYDGVFVCGSFRFGKAYVQGLGTTVRYGEFAGYSANGYAIERSSAPFGYASAYEGSFEGDSYVGQGRYADLSERYIYIGEFAHGRPEGCGDMILENGVTVHCDTVDRGSVIGRVTVTVPGEEPYVAEVGPRRAERTVTYSNGDVFCGRVSARGVPVEGTLTAQDGTEYSCRYSCGILIEKIKK